MRKKRVKDLKWGFEEEFKMEGEEVEMGKW